MQAEILSRTTASSIRRFITPPPCCTRAPRFVAHRAPYQYGRRGTPTTEALEVALQELEGPSCAGVSLLPSGLAAISAALLSVVKAGDSILVSDSVYGPTRMFCDRTLTRFGVTTTYYDPLLGGSIAGLMRENTSAVFVEAPGSLSFEMQDIPAIAAAAHARGAAVLMDNTWATPLYFRALDAGVDLVIHAGTKYFGGHADVSIGSVAANKDRVADLKNSSDKWPLCRARRRLSRATRHPDARGKARSAHRSGLTVARWLEQRPEISSSFTPRCRAIPAT